MNAIEQVKSALRRLELSDPQQTVYLSLLTDGQATPRTLAARTDLTRPSVYDQLKTLRQLGLVHELDKDGKAHYAAADLKFLKEVLDDRIDRLVQSREFLNQALPSLKDSFHTVNPKVRFFEGAEGVKQILKDLMWHDKETVQVVWNVDSVQAVFEPSFLKWFDERRAVRQLVLHSLWSRQPQQTDTIHLQLLSADQQKIISGNQAPNMSCLIYANKVAYISSNSEAFGCIVESAEFSALQTVQFSCLWQQATDF